MKFNRLLALPGLLIVCMAVTGFSKDWATSEGSCYAKGDKMISVGGMVHPLGLFAGFDYGFHDCISGGAAAGWGVWWLGDWTYYYIPIVARAAFHPFNLRVLADKIKVRDKFDVYVGLGSGWNIGFSHWGGAGSALTTPDVGGFTVREYVGARWHFSSNLSLFVEEGGGCGTGNVGLTIKF